VSKETTVRRAGRQDLAGIAALVRTATRGKIKVDEAEVMEWLFSKGLWVAVQGDRLVGVVAYQTENLLSVTDLFYVSPAKLRARVGRKLLETVEEQVNTLMCEANVLLLPGWTSKTVRTFLQRQGYESHAFADLHRIWREVLTGFVPDGDLTEADTDLMVKRLRERMVMVPI
jgi:N-acetylglutamate synthase-like GNAT family acetyltransferase